MALKPITYTQSFDQNIMFKWVGGRGGCKETYHVNESVTSSSADLGGSSKYSSEILEGRSGERFHENSNWS